MCMAANHVDDKQINQVDEEQSQSVESMLEETFEQSSSSGGRSNSNIGEEEEEDEISEFYRRDASDSRDVPIPNKQRLSQLLHTRFNARRMKQYEQVDEIDYQLRREFHVKAYDNPNYWTRSNIPPISYLRRRARRKELQRKKKFGPTGHDYQQVNNTIIDPVVCALTIHEIHTLLSRRLQHQLDTCYEIADVVKFDLLLNGVFIDDTTKQWRADGGTVFPTTTTTRNSNVTTTDKIDDSDDDDEDTDTVPLSTSNKYVENITSASITTKIPSSTSSSPYASSRSNSFKNNRKHQYEIDIVDDDDDDVVNDEDGVMSATSTSKSTTAKLMTNRQRRIESLIKRRQDAIIRQEHDVTDFLSYELYKTYNVIVDDTTCTWSYYREDNDDDEDIHHREQLQFIPTLPTLSSSLSLSSSSSYCKYSGRSNLKTSKSFPTMLFIDENVQYASQPYQQSIHSKQIDFGNIDINEDIILQRIQDLVQERIHLREERKYVEADAIRAELWYTYHVGINDRLKQWSIAGVLHDSEVEEEEDDEEEDDDFERKSTEESINDDGNDGSPTSRQPTPATSDGASSTSIGERRGKRRRRKRPKLDERYQVEYVEKTSRGFSQTLTPSQQQQVISLIRYLDNTRMNGNDGAADRILQRLYDSYRVSVDEERREWRVLVVRRNSSGSFDEDDDETIVYYKPRADTLHELSLSQRSMIQTLVERRYRELVRHRHHNNDETKQQPGEDQSSSSSSPSMVDTIAEALWKKYQIIINDNDRSWYKVSH